VNVILVGYRGTGKSCVAALLGEGLGWEVINLDAEIVRRAGQSIPEIVKSVGWAGFRDLEQEVCQSSVAGDQRVLDCGGGVVERLANRQVLRAAGLVCWLTATAETIVRRIQGDDQRPALTKDYSFTDEVSEVLARRVPLYQEVAHVTIATDARSLSQVADEIIRRVRAALGT
jgi:shikimate kinase